MTDSEADSVPDPGRGTGRGGRRAKRFLTPLQYEIWLQLIRQEVTMAEAADQHHVDRSNSQSRSRASTPGRDSANAARTASLATVRIRMIVEQAKAEGVRAAGHPDLADRLWRNGPTPAGTCARASRRAACQFAAFVVAG